MRTNRYESNRPRRGGLGFIRGLQNLIYNTIDLLRPDNGFYNDERPYSRDIYTRPQYYPGDYSPPVPRYSPYKEERVAYRQYAKENEIYKEEEVQDEQIDTEPIRGKGLRKKLQLKAKQAIKDKATATAETAIKVAKGTASASSAVVKAGVQDFKTIANNDTPKKDLELLSMDTDTVKEAFIRGFNAEDDVPFDLDSPTVTYTEVDLTNLQQELKYDTWYKSIISDVPVHIDVDELVLSKKVLTNDDIKGKKPLPLKKVEKHLVEDVIMIVPTKTSYAIITDKKKDSYYRDVQIRFEYEGNEDNSCHKYTCNELYIHAKSKLPITVYFKISSEEL